MNRKIGNLAWSVALLVAACGGGGGGSSAPPPPPPAPPVITGPASALPEATAGMAIAGTSITATGSVPITFAITAGSLPDGLALNANSGLISGTPLVLGTFDFTVTATNSAGAASTAFSQLVNPATPNANLLLSGNRIVSFNTNVPSALEPPVTLTNVEPGREIVAITRRPSNGFLYGFAVDDTWGSGVLYIIHPGSGITLPLASESGFANEGLEVVPVTGTRFGVHVSPGADVLRVANDTGQNFRFSMTGNAMDSDPAYVFAQMDDSINGPTNRVDALAYTNNHVGATLSTLYAIDSAIDSLCIQDPANSGTLLGCLPLSSPVDAISGFDIAPGVDTAVQGAPVSSGSATAVIQLAGQTTQRLAQIDLTSGAISSRPPAIGNGEIRSLAIQAPSGVPMYALGTNGTQLLVFSSASPSTVATRNITGVAVGEEIAGIDFNPQTGYLVGLGVNPALNTGTVYVIDTQTGVSSPLIPGGVAPVDNAGVARDLPFTTSGYGFDINPATGRIRVVTSAGLNFRILGGVAEDGNTNAAGSQADADVSPSPAQLAGLAYTNGLDVGGNTTTAYVVDLVGDAICRLAPDNAGTLTGCMPLLLSGASIPIPLGSAVGFDIAADARAPASGEPVSAGTGYLAAYIITIAETHLYEVNLVTGATVDRGAIGNGATQVRGLAAGLSAVR